MSDSEEAFAAARTEKDFVCFPEAGHSFEEVGAAELADPVERFLRKVLPEAGE